MAKPGKVRRQGISFAEEGAVLRFLRNFSDDQHRAHGLTEAQSGALLGLYDRLDRRDCRRRGVQVQ
ncbi:MAG TPA: hypothetical protein VM074_07110 [Solimonas sp.]|nr:hypothetical protein [Solimonas sp.]